MNFGRARCNVIFRRSSRGYKSCLSLPSIGWSSILSGKGVTRPFSQERLLMKIPSFESAMRSMPNLKSDLQSRFVKRKGFKQLTRGHWRRIPQGPGHQTKYYGVMQDAGQWLLLDLRDWDGGGWATVRNSRDIGRAWIVGFGCDPRILSTATIISPLHNNLLSCPPVVFPFFLHNFLAIRLVSVSIPLMCNIQSYSIAA